MPNFSKQQILLLAVLASCAGALPAYCQQAADAQPVQASPSVEDAETNLALSHHRLKYMANELSGHVDSDNPEKVASVLRGGRDVLSAGLKFTSFVVKTMSVQPGASGAPRF
jgi:hypothetical protein